MVNKMQNKSIWEKSYKDNNFKTIDKDLEIEVAIIGGGITGISVSYYLRNSNLDVSLFESSKIGHGITSKTTGKISYIQQGLLTKIKNIYNRETADEYYKSQKEATNLITSIIKDNNIECDLKCVDSYYFATNEKDIKKIKCEKDLLESFGESVKEVATLPDSVVLKYGIKCENTYVFNPIKYLNSLTHILKNSINIYENSKVTKIEKHKDYYLLNINQYKVKAKRIILASHYPYFLLPYLMPLKCSLEKSFIGAYKENSKKNFSVISHSKPVLSIRYIEDKEDRYKLILTNSKNLCLSENDEKNFKVLKQINPEYLWSNIDIITKDYMPYIGEISDNFYIATGYNTWGMTNATLAGKIISDSVLNKENKYISLFNPKRHDNLKTIIKYPLYAIENTYAFINSKIQIKKYKNVTIKKINGINVGIYKDDNGEEHIVKTTCPHLGCTLKFNEVEHTWDCPCHGSRFDYDGHVISGPSNYDISIKQKNITSNKK